MDAPPDAVWKREDNGCTSRGLFPFAQGPARISSLIPSPASLPTSTDIIGQRNTRELAMDFLVESKSPYLSLSFFSFLLRHTHTYILRCFPRLSSWLSVIKMIYCSRSRSRRQFLKYSKYRVPVPIYHEFPGDSTLQALSEKLLQWI